MPTTSTRSKVPSAHGSRHVCSLVSRVTSLTLASRISSTFVRTIATKSGSVSYVWILVTAGCSFGHNTEYLAERATDLEDRETGHGLRVEVAEERAEKMLTTLLLEGEVERCASRPLARDQ